MKNTFKKLLLCFLAAAAVITGSAAVKGMGDAENSGEPDKNVSLAASSKAGLLSARLAGLYRRF